MPKDHEKRAAFGVILWAVYELVINTYPLQINTLKATQSKSLPPHFTDLAFGILRPSRSVSGQGFKGQIEGNALQNYL